MLYFWYQRSMVFYTERENVVMKKIKINSNLFKYLGFILIYLSLLYYPLNNIVTVTTVLGTNFSINRLYEIFYFEMEYILMVVLLILIMLIYIVAFVFLNLYRYVKSFMEIFSHGDLWVIKITDKNDQDLEKEEYSEEESLKFSRSIRANFYGLILLYVISIMMSFFCVFANCLIG